MSMEKNETKNLEDKLDQEITPKIGDMIYMPTSLYLSHGKDDFCGGKAYIAEIKKGISAGKETYFVRIKERPFCLYNWEILLSEQKKLKENYGDNKAHQDPDFSEEFNDDLLF